MEAGPDDDADRQPRSRARRFAPLILVAGAIAAAVVLIPRVPHQRNVELRFEDPATIVGVHVDWLASSRRAASPGAAEDDPIQGTTWRFSPGAAPTSVTTTVRLPDGSYELEILLERTERANTVRRSITLGDADQIAVPIR